MPATGGGACVLLTGATGFLGKVVLGELLRQRPRSQVDRVYVLVRDKAGRGARARFQTLTESPCFAALATNWQAKVVPMVGNLSLPGAGLAGPDAATLEAEVTHIIHCAAAVDFDLPIKQAAGSNIEATLTLLGLARRCRRLVRMLSVSTAYVAPHQAGAIEPELAPLPRPAEALWAWMNRPEADKQELLALTGHPNTYTLTKCLAEHLLVARRGGLELTIVRPSIIAAALRHPTPGWIDSPAALAGFVMGIGGGAMRVVNARQDTRLDVVPVDVVAGQVVAEALAAPRRAAAAAEPGPVRIVHATMGLGQSATVAAWVAAIEAFFRRYPAGRRAEVRHLGPWGRRFRLARLLHQRALWALVRGWWVLTGQQRRIRAGRRVVERIDAINRVFPYFTHRSFDFTRSPTMPADFRLDDYLQAVCEGVFTHLMGGDPHKVVLGGARAERRMSTLAWALGRRRAPPLTRVAAWLLTHLMRRTFDEVSIDQKGFERALARVRRQDGADARLVVAPSHRSYADFLACSYLFFAKPHLGVPIPRVAAAEDFARIPLVGPLFAALGAFFIRRGGQGRDPRLDRQIGQLVGRRITLEFFIEGQRSRDRNFLPPRRGLLRCLQASGEPFVLLPVALSYDRVPEEAAFARELGGERAPRMRLGPLVRWLGEVRRGRVRLGRLHIACGEPVRLTADAQVHQVGHEVVAQLQAATVVTTFHLRHFAGLSPHQGLDAGWLGEAIVARGGTVLPSRLAPPPGLAADAPISRSLQHTWEHFFFADALHVAPGHVALAPYIRARAFAPLPLAATITDARLKLLLALLFQPVCEHLAQLAQALAVYAGRRRVEVGTQALIARAGCREHGLAEASLATLVALGAIRRQPEGTVTVVAGASTLRRLAWHSVWPEDPRQAQQVQQVAGPARHLGRAAPA